MEDTICAVATSLGVGAISIIRISGSDAITILNKVFSSKISTDKSHFIKHGYIWDNKQKIDEVLVSIMLGPKSYTTEDIVEINCHGGVSVTNQILELLLIQGCRLAEPGEFTKRAYLNGRIDLTQAESVSDMINAESEKASTLAINNMRGLLSKKVKSIRNQILSIQANIEVNIDYPEYEDAEVVTKETILPQLLDIKEELNQLLADSKNGQIIKNGINVTIVGKPNVGKSSILNYLLDQDKAIVTNVAGTTRDIVEGSISLNGFKLNLTDTAGIRDTNNEVEQIGVKKSVALTKSSDLIILVLNNNEELSKEDIEIINLVKDRKHIIFINKNDLESRLVISASNIVYGNTTSTNGLDKLKEKIIDMFNLNDISTNDFSYLSNARQISLVSKSLESIDNAIKNTNNNIPIDMLAIDIKSAWDTLGEIIGETYKDELLDELFSKFCLGK